MDVLMDIVDDVRYCVTPREAAAMNVWRRGWVVTHCNLSYLLLCCVMLLVSCSKDAATAARPHAIDANINITLTQVFDHVKLLSPVVLLPSPVNDTDWYLAEKSGRVWRINLDSAKPNELFVDIRDRVDSSHNESGLLGMAFHPDYRNNFQMFLSYTRSGAPLVSTISRFISKDQGKSLARDSEESILTLDQPYGNHNGGNIAFGPDGKLYIGFGDGGSGGDPKGNAQNTQTLLGSLLRLDVDQAKPYTIPKNNPFVNSKTVLSEIYAYGLRNPWRWSFDRQTGALWLADVGQSKWEEIDIIEAGGNYGWNAKEGFHDYDTGTTITGPLIAPVTEYSHDEGCSVTGGYVYRGQAIPALQGVYLYADFCKGTIWGLFKSEAGVYQSRKLIESHLMISSFAEGKDGEIYILHYGGKIYKLEKGNTVPQKS